MSVRIPRPWVLLTVTHALMVALGIYGGVKDASLRRDLTLEYTAGYARFAQQDAAELAFRFGTIEGAKVLIEDQPTTADFEVVLRQLRLAVLSGEHLVQATQVPHLLAAAAICERAQKCPCSLDKLRKQAADLAKTRVQ